MLTLRAFTPALLVLATAAAPACAQMVVNTPPPASPLAQPCRVDPFGSVSAADRATMLTRGCGGERFDYRIETQRVRPTDPGIGRVAAQVDAARSEPLADGLLATMRMQWAAAGSDATTDGVLRTERTSWSAGTWWTLHRNWALQMNFGREFTVEPRTRATVAGVWRPVRNALMFVEWAGTPDVNEGRRVGLRWWLVRNRLALEAGARHLADGRWADEQVSVKFGLLR